MAWEEAPNEIARIKVRIAFRDARTRQTKALEKETKKPFQAMSSGILEPTQNSELSSSSILSKRKNGGMSTPNGLFCHSQNHAVPGLDFSQLDSSINALSNNISQLNNTLTDSVQVSSSSTSDFLGLDSSNISKRQRLDSQKMCFNFL